MEVGLSDTPTDCNNFVAVEQRWHVSDVAEQIIINVVRLLTFVLTGLTACLLARDLGCSEAAALFAGAAFAFSPIRTDQIAHLSTLGTQWLPLVLLFAFRFFRTGLVHDQAAPVLDLDRDHLLCSSVCSL